MLNLASNAALSSSDISRASLSKVLISRLALPPVFFLAVGSLFSLPLPLGLGVALEVEAAGVEDVEASSPFCFLAAGALEAPASSLLGALRLGGIVKGEGKERGESKGRGASRDGGMARYISAKPQRDPSRGRSSIDRLP